MCFKAVHRLHFTVGSDRTGDVLANWFDYGYANASRPELEIGSCYQKYYEQND
jgi:hypothetical protein